MATKISRNVLTSSILSAFMLAGTAAAQTRPQQNGGGAATAAQSNLTNPDIYPLEQAYTASMVALNQAHRAFGHNIKLWIDAKIATVPDQTVIHDAETNVYSSVTTFSHSIDAAIDADQKVCDAYSDPVKAAKGTKDAAILGTQNYCVSFPQQLRETREEMQFQADRANTLVTRALQLRGVPTRQPR